MATNRKLFEDVSADTAKPVATTGVIDAGRGGARGAIRIWLMMLFGLVFLMILVGGATRLTDSGLSITEWRPLTGALPPRSGARRKTFPIRSDGCHPCAGFAKISTARGSSGLPAGICFGM